MREFINKGAKTKAKNTSYLLGRVQKYKTWLRMYAERCELVHSGFDDMEPQAILDALRDVERNLNSGAITFKNPERKHYALEAIVDMRKFKFSWKNNRWEDKEGNPIEI